MKVNFQFPTFLMTALSICIGCQGQDGKQRPNIILIVADDMNGFGVNKIYPTVQTPNLDNLATESINFKNAVCNAPVCSPSRASFFSGLYPHSTGAYLNDNDSWRRSQLMQHLRNLPEVFKDNGYTTFARGKITHDPVPTEREKQMWDNSQDGNGGYGPFPEKEFHYGGNGFRSVKAYEDDTQFPDISNADSIINFLKTDHQKPFFVYYGLWRPHTPYTAPKRFFDLYVEEEIELPPTYKENDLDDVPFLGRMLVDSIKSYREREDPENKKLKKFLYGYAANNSFADWNIGRVIEALDQSEHAENTLIIFFSDNGFHCGAKQQWPKATLWDMADIVPMLVRLPTKKSGVSHATISLIDVFPTLIEYCGLKPPEHRLDGESFAAQLEDTSTPWPRPSFTSYGPNYSSVRSERYRYIQYPDGTEELYDHERDPYEFENLAKDSTYEPIKEYHKDFIPKDWAPSLGGRLEVPQDFEKVMRTLTPQHDAYNKRQ